MSQHSEYISPASIRWRGPQPVSEGFDDIYFSADGEQEVQRIFLQPSRIIQRMSDNQRPWFTIGELGFGTGLNFTVCAEEVIKQPQGRLHFISMEAHPLSLSDWHRVAQARPGCATTQALAKSPPPLLTGWHRRTMHQGRVQLSVFHGDVATALAELQQYQRQGIDAWFLDGFAPSKNPEMWRSEVLAMLATLSAREATVATFTAAGQVRRDLSNLGFAMQKIDQKPFKRSSLVGVFQGQPQQSNPTPPAQIRVLGAGIAGATAARELANLGIPVQVFDPSGMASGGSKMSVSALHARLLGDQSPGAEFRARAFHHARASMDGLDAFRPTGALQLALNDQELSKLQRIYSVYQGDLPEDQRHWLTYRDASTLAQEFGFQGLGSLYFANACLVDLPQLCATLLDHPLIDFHPTAAQPSAEEPWVIACGSNARAYALDIPLEIGDVWGQLDWIKPTSASLPLPIVGNGYAIPDGETWVLGSTYEQRPWTRDEATASNIASNRRFIGDDDVLPVHCKRGPRCVSSDRDPIIGRLGEQRWISTAHGSIGTSSAPLAAAVIASDIMGWVPPVSRRVLRCVEPERFRARQARRGVKVVGPQN